MLRRRLDPLLREARREDYRVMQKVQRALPKDESIRAAVLRAERAMRGEHHQ